MLDRTEYVEQAYLFKLLRERIVEQVPLQESLESVQAELLTTTKLPMAVDYMLVELKHSGTMGPAMQRLSHYFAPFQAYLTTEAERETGRFDLQVALQIMETEAKYRIELRDAEQLNVQGLFLFHFECLCRNRLRYDPGIAAIAQDPMYDADWRDWLAEVRKQVGFIDLSDMIFLRSMEFRRLLLLEGRSVEGRPPFLFGEKEGRIAKANRRRDPLYLFSALQRHLGYPKVPVPIPYDDTPSLIPQLMRRIERMESRIKLLEEETRGGIDLTKFFGPPPPEQSDRP